MNDLYEYGSSFDVIIRLKSDQVIGGVQYQAGEIYTVLHDVTVSFTYEETGVTMDAHKPVYVANVQNLPVSFAIGNININTKIANLIMTKQSEQEVLIPSIEQCVSVNGELYTKYSIKGELYVYDIETHTLQENYTYENDKIKGLKDGNYLIYYCYAKAGIVYSLDVPYYPYFTIEMFSKGNKNKNTEDIYFKFPSVSMVQRPKLDFINNGVITTPFVFNIIYHAQPQPVVVIG